MEKQNKVMIIDDDETIFEIFKVYLREENYLLKFLNSGRNIIEHITQFNPDVILLDLMMPEISGFDICKLLKSKTDFEHIPVIIITALDDKKVQEEVSLIGADDFLIKPINMTELKTRVKSMLKIKRQYCELQKKNKLLEDMIYMIIHDMRNPLQTVFLNLLLIEQEKSVSDTIKQYTNAISKKMRTLKQYIDDLLMLAKEDKVKLTLKYEKVNLYDQIIILKNEYLPLLDTKKLMLVIDYPSDKQNTTINVDKNLFFRVLQNLLSNAAKYSPNGSSITIKVTFSKHSTNIMIIDEGYGIPKKYHTEIFDKYKTSTIRKSNVNQIGLGLSFCKMIISGHNGKISVTNNQPKGSIFTIQLFK